MLVNDILDMEKIVDNSKYLHWEGWSVIHSVPDEYAEMSNEGYFNRSLGGWYKKKVYHCGTSGWDIPDAVIS
jgi:hypothetical protein